MDPYSGVVYKDFKDAPPDVQPRLVEVKGEPEHIEHMSKAIKHYKDSTSNDKSKRRAANKAARKARKKNRK